jgi:hypothetical protein
MLFPTLIVAINLKCSKIVTDGKEWDLSKLGGPRSVMDSYETPPSWHNTTYTIDICESLKRSGDVPKRYKCLGDTRGEFQLHYLIWRRLQVPTAQVYKANP